MIINYIITRISRTRSKGTRTNLEIASLKEVIKSLAMHRAAFISFGRNSLVTAEGEVFFPRFKSGTTVFPGSRVKSVRRRRENIKKRCGTTVGIRSETAVGIFQLFSSGRRTCRDLGRGVETFSAKSSIGKKGKQEGGGEKVTRGNYPRSHSWTGGGGGRRSFHPRESRLVRTFNYPLLKKRSVKGRKEERAKWREREQEGRVKWNVKA